MTVYAITDTKKGEQGLRLLIFKLPESSWNVRSRGTKVPRERMFHRTKVLGTFAPEERKFHRSESSMERKFHGSESSLYGLFAPGNESAEERKGLESWPVVAMYVT